MNEWKSYRHCADASAQYGLPQINHSTLSKKASKMDYNIMKNLFHLIVSKCNRLTRRAMNLSKLKDLLIVDSITITVGKTRLPWAVYHGERSGINLHVSYSPKTDMPLQVIECTGLVHDGGVGERLIDPRFVMVEKTPKRDQADSPVIRDITCQLGATPSRSKECHRVVTFMDKKRREIHVVTNLMNVAPEVMADVYKARWKIESFFRWINQNLNVPVLFGTTENAVFNQLFAALITDVLLKWLYTKTTEGQVLTIIVRFFSTETARSQFIN